MWANLCIERMDRAVRQHKRLLKAYAKQDVEFLRLIAENDGQMPQPAPLSWSKLEARFQDHLYFFVLTARQAVKAAWVLEERGETMPSFPDQEALRAWRDYLEHWDAPARGKPFKAEETWQELSNEEAPGLQYSGYGHELVFVSGMDLRDLLKYIKAATKAAEAVSNREWERCYITAEEAASILSMSIEEFEDMPNQPMHMDFGKKDGVRYWREWVEARRDGVGVPQGWEDHV